MPLSGGTPRRLTDDGNEVFFRARGSKPGTMVLHRIPVAGGESVQVTEGNSWGPRSSPDGTRLTYHTYNADEGHNQIEIMELATGVVEHVIYLRQWEEAAWSPDGAAIHFSKHVDGQDNVWSNPISAGDDTSGDVQPTDFDDHIDIHAMIWSGDGRTLAPSRGKTSRDIVLLKGFR